MIKSIPILVFIMSLLHPLEGISQGSTVTGSVTYKTDGSTLPGVNVQVRGGTQSTSTGASGEYSIEVPSDTSTLTFSMIGMVPQSIPVGNQTTISVALADDQKTLEEVVVIGYGTANKRDLTGSIVTVQGKDVADKPAVNPIASLQGKVAGLSVVNSGRPGAEPDVRVRGTNTINGVKPVYIVDGILNDNINFLNPADIESMEVLKDPSSLAIFGVRGANGAIAVTTKKAKAGQMTVNFNSTLGFKTVSNRMKMANAMQFRELFDEQLGNDGNDPFNYENWMGNTDWQNEVFQTAALNYNNVSIAGASEKNKFYMGIGTVREEGVIKHEMYKKLTLNVSDEIQLAKNLKFGFTLNAYRAELPDAKNVDYAIRASPIAPVSDAASGLFYILPPFQGIQVSNPMVEVDFKRNTAIGREFRGVGSIFGEWNIIDGLALRATLYADYGFKTSRSYQPIVSVYNPVLSGENKADTLIRQTRVNQSESISPKLQQDYLLTYSKNFGQHDFQLMAGITSYYQAFEETTAQISQGTGYPIPNDERFWYVGDVGDAATRLGGGSAWESATLSYLARAIYNYQGKYLVNASFRRDGSSAFLGNNRWQNFVAVGLGWVLSDEGFFKNVSFIDYLKLKGSWGILGNQNIDTKYRYPAYPTLTSANSGVFGDNIVPGLQNEYLADPNLHWETVNAWEIGFEAYLIKRKLQLEFNYYDKLTNDVLVLVPGIAGTIPGLGNLGEISNKGFESSASWNEQIGQDLSYSLGGNFTTFENRVSRLSTEGYAIINGPSRTIQGFPVGYFWGYRAIGIYQNQAEIDASPASNIGAVLPGDLKYEDVTGDGTINNDDRTMIGNPTPKFSFGASGSIAYKGFDLSVEVNGVYGNDIFREWNRNTFAQFNFLENRLDRWNGEGTSNSEPILSSARANNNQISSYWVEDGSFFRIRNLQIGYNFPAEMLSSIRIKSLRLYANAQNPFTFARNTGFTPEIGGTSTAFGIDNGTYPVPSIYSLGLNLNF